LLDRVLNQLAPEILALEALAPVDVRDVGSQDERRLGRAGNALE
jgi:hypothetical protein